MSPTGSHRWLNTYLMMRLPNWVRADGVEAETNSNDDVVAEHQRAFATVYGFRVDVYGEQRHDDGCGG